MPLPNGVLVSSLAVVNAFGDVRDPSTGKIVAGARKAPDSHDFINTVEEMKRKPPAGWGRMNTTLGVVATNAKLSKLDATKLARFAGLALGRCIYPINTSFDGDTVFALSMGDREGNIDVLGAAAAEALAEAILRSVRMAKTMGGVPGLNG